MTPAVAFLFLLLPAHFFLPASPACTGGQAAALLQLKRSIANATSLSTWDTVAGDCCHGWHGVECAGGDGVVTGLDLSGLSLFLAPNFIFPSLANLTGLDSLNLGFNRFNFSFPPNLDELRQLRRLNLSNAGFSGQIPRSITRMKSLVSLDLSLSLAISTVSIKLQDPDFKTLVESLPALEELYLDGVNISSYSTQWDSILASSLPKLRNLSLANCFISGPLQDSLSRLQGLSTLRLDDNPLSSEVPPFLSTLPSLTSLRLSSCQLRGEFPQSILGMQSLRILDLANNPNLTGRLPEFAEHSLLQELSLSATMFSGPLPSSIGKLSFLTKLQLSQTNLSGELPASLGNLTQLVYLDISANRFTGQIPSLADLAQLFYLDLGSNRFNGSFPVIGEGLKKLTVLNLRNNSINGSIPPSIFTLPLLKSLLLDVNLLGGGIEKFTNASVLETVDLSYNAMQGPIPQSLFELPRLKVLKLSSNNFSGGVKLSWLSNLKTLSVLELSNNRLSVDVSGGNYSQVWLSTLRLASCDLPKFPEFLKSQAKLTNLDLSNNRISGEIPTWIWSIPSLRYLNLSRNLFSGSELRTMINSSSPLVALDLHSNKLSGPIPLPPSSAIIVDCSNNSFTSTIPPNIGSYLEFTIFFSLSRNDLNGGIPQSFCNATYLQVLDLSGNRLTGPIPSCLGSWLNSSIRVLNLRSNSVNGYIPDTFSGSCALRTLDLNGNNLSGLVPRSLKNCKNLTILNLGNNQLQDSFPSWLGNISKLSVLVLRSNRLYGSIESCADAFRMVKIMDLSSNHFDGILPSQCFASWKSMMADGENNEVDPRHPVIQLHVLRLTPLYYRDSIIVTVKGLELEYVNLLTIFTSVDLSNNRFSGVIPETIGKLNLLYVLNLSRNALAGPIPKSIGKLVQLESLDLSVNNLSGAIPTELVNLNFLSSLNLSYNSLAGVIPQGGQLNTFSQSSYEHNLGLCGLPLKQMCSVSPKLESENQSYFFSHEVDWQLITTGLGFGGGFGMVFGPLMFWKKGRKWFNKHVDWMYFALVPDGFISFFTCAEFRIEAGDGIDQETMEASSDEEEERPHERFCVFCTKLDSTGARIIHIPCYCKSSPPFSS